LNFMFTSTHFDTYMSVIDCSSFQLSAFCQI
jgi:hypothetical protein